MFSGGTYQEVERWLRNFLTAHAKRVDPRLEVVFDDEDEREGSSYGVRLRYGRRLGPTLELSFREVADNRGTLAWCTTLADARTLYVQYNRVRDTPEESVERFVDRVFTMVGREGLHRLILDIRLNGGGNMSLNRPLIHRLIRCDALNQWGKFFVIIGRLTFSAAMNLAVDLERHTRALFVGEPTGARPNHYGENADIVLPHSGLRCTASALWWQYSDPRDDRPWIAPDIPAALWSADYAANRDPAVEAILRYVPDPTRAVRINIYNTIGQNDSRERSLGFSALTPGEECSNAVP